jgi:hypothetical protein
VFTVDRRVSLQSDVSKGGMMKDSAITFPAHSLTREIADDAAQVLDWIDDLVVAGIAEFDDSADEFPLLHLVSGDIFVLSDSSITRVR